MYQSLHLLDGVDHARNYGIHPIPLHIYNEKRAVLPRLLCLCCAQHFWFAELFWGLLWYSTLLCMHKFVRGKYKPKNTELDSSLQAVRSTRSCSGRGAALALATGAPSRRNWHGTPPGMSPSCKHVAQRFMFKALPYLQLESLVCRISSAFNLETTLMPKWNQLNLLKTVVQAKKKLITHLNRGSQYPKANNPKTKPHTHCRGINVRMFWSESWFHSSRLFSGKL